MNPAVYAVVLLFLLLPLYAADTITSGPVLVSDSNTCINAVDLSLAVEANPKGHFSVGKNLLGENNATAYDFNSANRFYYPDFQSGMNWFYYRDLLAGMDTIYIYGTNAVIVIGSGIDYSLYRLFSDDTNSTVQARLEAAAIKEENAAALFGQSLSSECNQSVQQHISSLKGKIELPPQLASHDKRKGERTYLLSEWFDEKTLNSGFLDSENNSYIRLRGGYSFDYRGEGSYILNIDARVMIPRTQKKLHLIIGDETKNSSDLSLQGTDEERDNSIALGVNDFLGILDPVESKIRFGFSGIMNPYARAAFSYESLLGSWLMLPSQTFRYSLQD
ncbi:MAG: hypothetical protein MUP09_11790, partial [Thiovulaceae bacterium]|nr:hypothetical protein [Sulfurimonadaceae bacterium]